MLDQIQKQVDKAAKQKLNAYRNNLKRQFQLITPANKEDRKVNGNNHGQDNIFEWTVETFFLVYDNVDKKGSDAMRGDENEMAEAWGAWRFIYHQLTAFIDGLPEDAKVQRCIFNRLPVGQALINIILLSTFNSYNAWRSKEKLISESEYYDYADIRSESGFRDKPSTFLLARGDQAGSGCSLLGQGYLEEDLLHLFKDRTIKDMIGASVSKFEQSVTISGSGLKIHE